MSAGRICVREVYYADDGESVREVAERMRHRAVGVLAVLNAAKEPIGIVTDRDLVVRVLATGKDADSTTVGEVMTPAPKTVSEETSIESALSLMRSGQFRRLPVVNDTGQLIGLITLDDVLMLLSEEFAVIGRLLESESPPRIAGGAAGG